MSTFKAKKTPEQYFAQVRAALNNPETARRVMLNGSYSELLDLLTILTTADPLALIDEKANQTAIDHGQTSPQYNVWYFAQKALKGE